MADDLTESMDDVFAAPGPERQRRERRTDDDRRIVVDRRADGPADYCETERRQGDRRIHAERRLGGIAGRRVEDRKAFEDRIEKGELSLEEVEFVRAIDRYKRRYNRPFPTWSEVLLIAKELGYTKDAL
jgi:hypothetical protein